MQRFSVSKGRPADVTTTARLPGLDLLRGLAIFLVLVRHAFPGVLPNGGIVGVVVFFTLSGYLITGLLVREHERTGMIALGEFFRRRALRLFPPLLFLLAVFAVVELLTDRLGSRWYLAKSIFTAVTYTSNLPLLPISPGLSHLWTLAIEEQFYLLWPFVLLLGLRRRRVWQVTVAAIAVSWAATALTLVINIDDVGTLYTMPTSWSLTLLVGALARLLQGRVRRVMSRPLVGGITGLAVVLSIAALPGGKESPLMYLVGGPVIALATVLMIVAAVEWRSTPRALEPLRLLGVVSYSVYLWNYFLVCLIRGDGKSPVTWEAGLGGAVGSVVMAIVAWHLIERPVRDRWGRRRAPQAEPSAPDAVVPAGRPTS